MTEFLPRQLMVTLLALYPGIEYATENQGAFELDIHL